MANVKSNLLAALLASVVAGSAPPKAAAFLGSVAPSGSGSTITFTAAISAVAYDRYILCFCNGLGAAAGSLTSCTIAGVAGTLVNTTLANGSTLGVSVIALIPANTSGDVVVVWSNSHTATFLGLYEITGITSTTPVGVGSTTTDNLGVAVTTVDGGFLFGSAHMNGNGSTTWTNITEDDDQDISSHTVSHAHIATTGSSVTATADVTNTAQVVVQYCSF